MSNIIDRRGKNKNKLSGSRAKFIKRYKNEIKNRIDQHIKNKDLSDINSDIDIVIGNTEEVKSRYSTGSGKYKAISPGNKKYNKGDKFRIPKNGEDKGSKAGNSKEMTKDEFTFILNKKEFMDILFEDMELPNFLKKSTKIMNKSKLINGGYTKQGIPSRLAIKKTLENSIARKIINKNSGKKCRFLDDIDLRFRNTVEQQEPTAHAVVFMVMDISGSMNEPRKLLAKKFFLLLYLFLQKHYTSLDVRFISHTTDAWEVDEHTFFYSNLSGGTIISPAISLVNNIIDKEYDIDETNIYIAQASDGDNWSEDFEDLYFEIEKLLPKVQYMAYVEIDNRYPEDGVAQFYRSNWNTKKLTSTIVDEDKDVFKGLYDLFGVNKK